MNFNYLPLLTGAAGAVDLMNNPMSFGERLIQGLQVTLFGMAVVFSVLILLWGILEIFRIIFYELPKKQAEKAAKAEPVPAEPVAPAPVEAPVEAVEETDDAEIVAAITAAISVVMDKPQTSFRVVSFRRTASK